jgi:mannose-1-phosphate guanylyltransferase
MISYLINSLPKEVSKVVLAVNYKKDQISKYFELNDFGKEIIVNDEPKPLGTGGAVKFAERYITGPFLVLNADIICSLSIEEMIRFHKRKKAVSTISLWPVEDVSQFGVVDIKSDGNVIRFVEKPKRENAPSNLINAGAYFLEPTILDYIDTGRLVSMEKEVFPQIIEKTGRFYGFKFEGYWIDVGRISSYIEANKLLLKSNKLTNLKGERCQIKGDLINSCIGNDVFVGVNSFLESSIVFNNVEIGKNVRLNRCVIGENCEIGNNSTLKNTVVGDNETIAEEEALNNRIVWSKPIPDGYPEKQIGNVLEEEV